MRSYRYLITGVVLLLCLQATAAVRHPLAARQDDSPSSERSEARSSTRANSSRSPSPTAQSDGPSPSKTLSERSSQTSSDVAAGTTVLVTATTAMQAPATGTSGEAEPTSSTEADSANPLPIHPKITPAIGLSGVILLLSGAVYAFIGIKNKWLYVFFSAAYLTSLAVTVLIVYLMSPPVSDAVQAAFFVAAFLTGLIFGALSLVFSDITDGLGCLLGGFCLSMWFLTLKEGGLIASPTGRAIFIGCMSIAGFSLSFSHYTRNYGLIVSISFAGATVTMLGVDCFSRGGWKEFWLYLWDLNGNIFPLNTTTYPLTRVIKVEAACVVLLTVFGIISQLKLWKLVKERREKTAALRLERDRNLAREEEEVGRKIEDSFTRERAQWERIYGDGDTTLHQDSVIEPSDKSIPKTSTSVRERKASLAESMEMVILPPKPTASPREGVSRSASKKAPTGQAVTVTVLRDDDEIQQIDDEGNLVPAKEGVSQANPGALGLANASADASDIAHSTASDLPRSASTRSSPRSSAPPPPVVVPLPFTVPEEDTQSADTDNTSVSAVPESVHESRVIRRPLSNRLSGGSILKRLSASRAVPEDLEEEAFMVPHIEDDRASSLAATLDDEYDNASLLDMPAPQSPAHSAFDERTTQVDDDGVQSTDALGETEQPVTHDTSKAKPDDRVPSQAEQRALTDPLVPASAVQQSLTVSTDPEPAATHPNRQSSSSPRQRYDTMVSQVEAEESPQSKSAKSGAPSLSSQTGSQIGLSKEVLPEKLSKVALSYRTNEWAKHLELAEKPELDEIPEPESPGVKLAHDSGEQPALVSDEIKGVEPPVKPKPISKRASTESNVYRNSNLIRSASNMSRNSLVDPSMSRTSVLAAGGVSRATSGAQRRGVRSSSTPFPAQVLDVAAARLSNTPSPIPNPTTLMGQREALVRNKLSSQSLTPHSSSPNLSELEQENMTLARRKQLMQHQKPPSSSQQWRQSNWAIGGQVQGFDSHQPRRLSGGVDPNRREVMLANWRESMRQDGVSGQNTTMGDDGRRMALINERRQKELEKQQRAAAAQQRESMMDNMMRSGEMLDAHREAMRRMQAKANRNA